LVCSNVDKTTLNKELPDLGVMVIPNGVDTDYFQPNPIKQDEITLLFTGSMTYLPNWDAVHYFIKEIFPLVKKKYPSCVFVVAGSDSSRVFPEYTGRLDIKLVDSPSDMRPYYNCTCLVVVPLRSGSGTRLKILEAMAMRKPVVSTSVGAEGIDYENKRDLYIANSPEEFLSAIHSLLQDKALRISIGERAYQKVLTYYNWIHIRNQVKHFLTEFI
jgi:glycosyltransferase involved in cell wall biosynthesis